MPGGKVDSDETLEEAIIREVLEETGLNIYNIKPIFTDVCEGKYPPVEDFNCTTFLAEYSGVPQQKEEGIVSWISKEDLLNGAFGKYNQKLFDHIDKLIF